MRLRFHNATDSALSINSSAELLNKFLVSCLLIRRGHVLELDPSFRRPIVEGSKFSLFPLSDGVIFSSVFKRATALREISRMVQFSTSFSNVVLDTSIILSAIPTCPPVIRPRKATAIAITLVAMPAARRSRTILSHLWRDKRRNSGRWESSTRRTISRIISRRQSKDRIVSRPST